MRYIDVVNRIGQTVSDHLILKDVGYGNISDLKHRSEQTTTRSVDYPYLFINPTTHGRRPNAMVYRFNIIVMDMVDIKTDNFLKIQSECQQYVDDVLARLKLFYNMSINTEINYVPFKERFQDDVAGITAEISITVPVPLNSCIAPFSPTLVPFVWNLNTNLWNEENRDFNES